eukprot:3850781-Karenia_brevis.AAC.1
MIEHFLLEFDGELRKTLGDIIGLVLSDDQWEQATLGIKRSGLGVCSASNIADAAYLASRAQTHEDCKGLDSQHVWDDGVPREGGEEVIGEWLMGASMRYDDRVPLESAVRGKGHDIWVRGEFVTKLEMVRFNQLRDLA